MNFKELLFAYNSAKSQSAIIQASIELLSPFRHIGDGEPAKTIVMEDGTFVSPEQIDKFILFLSKEKEKFEELVEDIESQKLVESEDVFSDA